MAFEKSRASVQEQVALDASYLTPMASAGILAAVALLTTSTPMLIGSMVIAPVLAPLELVALAAVHRQPRLVVRGGSIAAIGLLAATLGAVATTLLLNATGVLAAEANLLAKPLLEERVRPGWYSVIAAAAAGVAGIVATVQHRTDTLVGVVAALAIVPAAAAGGIALLSGDPTRATGGFSLLFINVGLILLTGIATLLVIHVHRNVRE